MLQLKLSQLCELGNLCRQSSQLLSVDEVQPLQLGQFANLGRQSNELAGSQVELLKLSQLTNLRRKAGDLWAVDQFEFVKLG